MINPEELRIGNIVKVNGDKLAKVISIASDVSQIGVRYLNGGTNYYSSIDVSPASLSNHYLRRLGFTKENGLFLNIEQKEYQIALYTKDNELRIRIEMYPSIIIKTVEHVHELQNFIYAVTGKSITFKR